MYDKIEKLQRRAAWIIMETNSSDDALERLAYDTLELRHEIHTVKLVKQCLNKRCPEEILQRKT